jgi:copper chaperone CopZ
MNAHELKIQGMSCNHCVVHVKNALDEVDGLEIEDVQIGNARVWFDKDKVSNEVIAAKIDEAGYKLVSVQ